jgi:hypothetical protein
MKSYFKITYGYKFDSGATIQFNLVMDEQTLLLVSEDRPATPEWMRLGYHKCALCPLDERTHASCPVAANLAGISEKFKQFASHDRVSVAVLVEERTYSKNTTVEQGLSPLIGIIMTTSGCPIMEQLKPMVRYHLPFASVDETVFRMVSMYLVAQYLRRQAGATTESGLEGLKKIYSEVGQVNRDFSERLSGAAQSDANVNALVHLDAFAKIIPLAADDLLKKIAPYFSALLR